MNLPRVTVLIPVHNDEKYIAKAIDSAVAQNYSGLIQICVIDDGSKDGSWQVVQDLYDTAIEKKDLTESIESEANFSFSGLELTSGKYKGVQLTVLKRSYAGGPSAARNSGIRLTINHTDIYAMLDSDDEFYPDKVRKCVSLITTDPKTIGAVYADYDTYDVNTCKTIREFKEPYNRRRLVEECIVHSGSVVSKLALEQVIEGSEYYDESMRTCEDYDLWMRISEKFLIMHIPEALTFVRITDQNSSAVVHKETWEKNWLRVMEKMQQRQYAIQ